MKLKFKIGLFFNFFIILPIFLLGGYQSFNAYHSQLDEAQRTLTADLLKQQDTLLRFFDGACRDMEFCARAMEINKLLTAFEDEDDDEISYWSEALDSVLLTFTENRKIFSDLRFTILSSDKPLLRVILKDGKPVSAEPLLPPAGYQKAQSSPLPVWRTGTSSSLWLHLPIHEGETTALVSAEVDLHYFYKLLEDKEIYLIAPDQRPMVVRGRAVKGGDAPARSIPVGRSPGFPRVTIDENYIMVAASVPLIRWQEKSLFTLAKARKKEIIMAPIKKNLLEMGVISLLTILIAAGTGYMFINSQLIKPLFSAVRLAEKIADGDMTVTINASRRDEIGNLLDSLNTMSAKLRKILLCVTETSQKVSVSSVDLLTDIKQVSDEISEVSGQADNVAVRVDQVAGSLISVSEATTEMAGNADSIAGESSTISTNITNVAAAVEEMSATIREISENTTQARDLAGNARAKSDSSEKQLVELQAAAQAIDQVVKVINDIAEQTKLLALNATIEASRAGEAGKGFAVVANEVKELARQTADATDDIVSRIQEMQEKTGSAVKVMAEISGITEKVSEINTSVASAVEEQAATVDDMTVTVSEIARGSTRVSASIQQLSETISQDIVDLVEVAGVNTQDISKRISRINNDTATAAEASLHSRENAANLEKIAGSLQEETRQFKLT